MRRRIAAPIIGTCPSRRCAKYFAPAQRAPTPDFVFA